MTNQKYEAELNDLLSQMTLDEKVAQLRGMSASDLFGRPTTDQPKMSINPERLGELRPHGVGHVSLAWFMDTDFEGIRDRVERIQKGIQERSPFGIGALIHFEAINGVVQESAPQFPTSWGQACTWTPQLTQDQAEISAEYVRSIGGNQVFSPVMDLARDSRWGRVHETYGEDPELVAQFSVAFTKGVQGKNNDSGVLATGKHFLGYGASEGGLNQAITQLGRRALVDEYAEPFRRAIAEADLASVMNSYNEIDGVPAAADHWLLTKLLRHQLGFKGLTVSDYDSIVMLETVYHTASSSDQAGVQALTAGLDVDFPMGTSYANLAEEVRLGRLDETVVDQAVLRVLRAKAAVGLIPSMTSTHDAASEIGSLQTPETVRNAIADRAVVLLKNDGVLPLQKGNQKVLVTGPAANELRIHFGAYTSVSQAEMDLGIRALRAGEIPGVSPEEAIFTDNFQVRMPGIEPQFEETVKRLHPEMVTLLNELQSWDPDITFAPFGSSLNDPSDFDLDGLEKAISKADIVIAALGERTGWAGNNTAGEGQSTSNPLLPGDQETLVEAIAKTGKPLISVIVSGRPLVISELSELSSAVVLAPLLGEASAPAIVRVLTGDVNPSGKLPSTFPRSAGQQPMYHGHHMGSGYDHPTGIRHGYNDHSDQQPLYAFGHGLSYTSFDVELLDSVKRINQDDGDVVVRVKVTNTGDVAGETVVQLYGRDEHASIVRPVRQLLQFARVGLAPGESKEVELTAPVTRFAFTGLDGVRKVEPGEVRLQIGLASDDIRAEASAEIK